jgi:hypothetical protein
VNRVQIPLVYDTISIAPSLLSPKIRSTNVIGTSPTEYPNARARTIISIWNTYPFDTVSTMMWRKTGSLYSLRQIKGPCLRSEQVRNVPKTARQISDTWVQNCVGEEVGTSRHELAFKVPAMHATRFRLGSIGR